MDRRWRIRALRRVGWESGRHPIGSTLGFDVDKQAFVATATAIGLVVDAARMPVYFATQPRQIAHIWVLILIATLGALAGHSSASGCYT